MFKTNFFCAQQFRGVTKIGSQALPQTPPWLRAWSGVRDQRKCYPSYVSQRRAQQHARETSRLVDSPSIKARDVTTTNASRLWGQQTCVARARRSVHAWTNRSRSIFSACCLSRAIFFSAWRQLIRWTFSGFSLPRVTNTYVCVV